MVRLEHSDGMAADLSSDKKSGRRRVNPLLWGSWPAARPARRIKVRLLAYGEVFAVSSPRLQIAVNWGPAQ